MAYDRLVLIDGEGKIITCRSAGTLTGGDILEWYSGTDTVGSNISTYDPKTDCVVRKAQNSGLNCVGLALTDAGSTNTVAVLTEGFVILQAGSGGISGGYPVMQTGYANMVDSINVTPISGGHIGRAYNKATALTGFAVVKLNL